MRQNLHFFLPAILLLLSGRPLFSQNLDSLMENRRVYTTVHIGDMDQPKIDGLLEDDIWSLGDWQGSFSQQQPVGNVPATERTWIKVLYDRSFLFVAIVCEDSDPEKIRDIFTRRDGFGGEMTGIALDSYFDKRTAFEFNMSAAGQKMDVKHLGDYQWDFNWNGVWDGASSINDSAWIAEMRIPFSQLRYADQEEHIWGMHVWRWNARKHEEDQWQFIPLEAPAMVYLFGELHGIKNIRESRQVEFLPYVSAGYDLPADAPGSFLPNAGLNAKVGISSDFTLDLSINPDYGQVEADPSVLNLTAFETFYDEKRPFFMEGNDIFDFELDGDIAYYSRRIGSAPHYPNKLGYDTVNHVPRNTTILGAAKFTGKTSKGLSLGVVNGLTAPEYARLEDTMGIGRDLRVAPLSNYFASRVKRDFREGNTVVGGMFSLVNRRNSDPILSTLLPASAFSGGLDLLHYWNNKNYYFQVKSIASQLQGSREAILKKQLSHIHQFQRPDADYLEVDSTREQLGGHGGLLEIGKKGGRFNFSLNGQYRSAGLNLNDMGYIRQSDFMGQGVEISYKMNDPGKWVRNYELYIGQDARWSLGGENIQNKAGVDFLVKSVKNWSYHVQYYHEFSHLDTRELRGGPALRVDGEHQSGFYIKSDFAKDLSGGFGAHANSFHVKGSHQEVVHGSIAWLPVRKVKLSAKVSWNSLKYHQHYVNARPGDIGGNYLVGQIDRQTTSLTFRAEVFFSPEMSLQYYGSPYYSVGSFDGFRRVDQAGARELEQRLEAIDIGEGPDAQNNYSFGYMGETFSFGNPDFSFMQFRSNLVFRWEYKLGSTLYMVWAHDRSDWRNLYNPIGEITGGLSGLEGNHIFMLKLNFWFSV